MTEVLSSPTQGFQGGFSQMQLANISGNDKHHFWPYFIGQKLVIGCLVARGVGKYSLAGIALLQ